MSYNHLTEQSTKTLKGEKIGVMTGILYLSAASNAERIVRQLITAGSRAEKLHAEKMLRRPLTSALAILAGKNLCPYASAGCAFVCLGIASGHFAMVKKGNITNNCQLAQIRRTIALFENRAKFLADIAADIKKLVARADAAGMIPAVRLNGTSDLRFDIFGRELFEAFPTVIYYDYSKDPKKLADYIAGRTPGNYHLTFSYSETMQAATYRTALAAGVNLAVAYVGQVTGLASALALPADTPVISGDDTDVRFLDPAVGALVSLTAKGRAKRDSSGFVVRTA